MSILIKKRQILAATLVIALVAATAVNWYYSQYITDEAVTTSAEQVSGNLGDSLFVAGTTAAQNEVTTNQAEESSDEYFADAKLKRQKTYDKIIDDIEDLLDEEKVDAQLKTKINSVLSSYVANQKTQVDAENLISAKTGSKCIVVINNNACQVIMEKNTLNSEVILQITEIIQKNTNISAENLTIIELK